MTLLHSRRPLAALMALVVALSLLALPPVRAAADQFLQVFRVRTVLFMPVSPERIEQLRRLDFDEEALFVAKPTLVNQPAAPRAVASASEAAAAVGFPVGLIAGDTPASILVHDRHVYRFQVDVAATRQLLALMDVRDVTIPDALGAEPITADLPPFAVSEYRVSGGTLTLRQGRSPSVKLPEGVDLQQLGKAALRLLGMEPDQAEQLSRQIDWSSTLLFPIPPAVSDVRQVSIGEARGMLVGARGRQGQRQWLLYWQRGEQFYVLEGEGRIRDAEMITAAESVR